MNLIKPSRRGFITGLASTLAAPAIVRATSIMPVKALPLDVITDMDFGGGFVNADQLTQLIRVRINIAYEKTRAAMAESFYGNLCSPVEDAIWRILNEQA